MCLGTGPSLTPADIDAVRAVPTVAINDAIFAAPHATVHYAPDAKWWNWHGARAATLPAMAYTLRADVAARFPHVAVLGFSHAPGLSTDPALVHTGGHGGYQAINLAAHLVGPGGRIILLGYDLQPAADGAHHYFGEHPDGSHVRYAQWAASYTSLMTAAAAMRIRVINASRETAITAVPRRQLREALRGYGLVADGSGTDVERSGDLYRNTSGAA